MDKRYTHKGWIGLCPVYIGDKDSASPDIDPRFPCTEWLLHLSLWIFDVVGSTNPDDSGGIPIRITEEIK
jgi:hypothetical protein